MLQLQEDIKYIKHGAKQQQSPRLLKSVQETANKNVLCAFIVRTKYPIMRYNYTVMIQDIWKYWIVAPTY